jgi:lysophospholipid acyltransferase (LPLAT)-like uncharacterized protein
MSSWIYRLGDQLKINIVAFLGYWVICILGKTLRWKVHNWQSLESVYKNNKRIILTFWHGRILATSYYFRQRGIVVLTSQHRDGEYIGKIIEKLGYGVARGSSSKGSYGAAMAALRALNQGKDIGFAIDGPRGPKYQVKSGATYLAWKTGNPVVPFHVDVEKKWTLSSWDEFQIPKPFSRAILIIGDPMYIRPEEKKEIIPAYEQELQKNLDLMRFQGDSWWNKQSAD